jgi:hypothetical protein
MFPQRLRDMLPWNGLLDRSYGWSCAITILTGVLAVVTLSVGDNVYAAQKKAGILQDKTEALLKSGYVELSGDDAVSFLVGNSVLIKKTDAPKGLSADESDQHYYFSGRHTAYECVANDCWTQFWKVDGKEICFEIPSVLCDDPTHRFYAAPRLFKAPREDKRTGRIGVYLTYKSIIHAVIRGNVTIAPLLEPNGVGKMIEVNSADFAQEVEAHDKLYSTEELLRRSAQHRRERPGDKVLIKGPRAISLLIGNTFISGETATDEHGGVHLCPVLGYYYSPGGRIITFNCHHWPDHWGMGVTHWKLASDRLCIEDVENLGAFGCGDRFERVYLVPSDRQDEWVVITEDFPRKIVGYAGNIFNFK